MSTPKSYLSVSSGLSGFYAVMLVWDSDLAEYDIGQTGVGRYATFAEAEAEARDWAKDENLEYKP